MTPLLAVLVLALVAQEPLPEGALFRLAGHSDAVRAVAWSPDGGFIITGSRDRTLVLWDSSTGKRLRAFEGHGGGVTSVAISPDGKHALSGSQDRTIIVWETASGKALRKLEGHGQWVTCVTFTPDGRKALSGSHDRTAAIWDVPTGNRDRVLPVHANRVLTVAASPDGLRWATAGADHAATLWNAETGERRVTLPSAEQRDVFAAAFSPDGKRIATGHQANEAFVWEVESGKATLELAGHAGWVLSCAFSPDGLAIATGSQDETVALWDSTTGRRLARLMGPRGRVSSLAWSPGGRRLVTGSEDGTAIVWQPWSAEAAKAEEWAKTWPSRGEEERARELRDVLAGLKSADARGFAEAREKLLRAGGSLPAAVTATFAPEGAAKAPDEARLKQLLAELDSDDFGTRVASKKALVGLGRAILPWVEQQLKRDDLSVEARSAMGDIRSAVSAVRSAAPDDGRERALMILVEMPASDGVKAALQRYADGADTSPATRLARRALGR